MCVGGGSCGSGGAGLGRAGLTDSPPDQVLLEVVVTHLPSLRGLYQGASIRVRRILNKPQNAIRQERDGKGGWLKGQPSVSCQT